LNDNFICHPASGCVCREGFRGDQCDIAIYSPVSDKSQLGEPIVPVNHGGLIGGLIVSILLIVIVIGALVYYRRRISHLKSELAHVQYIADPSSAPGTSSFLCLFLFFLLFILFLFISWSLNDGEVKSLWLLFTCLCSSFCILFF
jgi:hypothetical protein